MHVEEIWRYPVKSLRGERLQAADLGRDGIPGDRAVHVVDGRGELVTARTRHSLLTVPASYEGEVLVDGEPWQSTRAAARVREAVGEDTRLVASEGGHRFDDTALLLATDGAIAWTGADRRRFRPNLVIGGVDGLAERSWPGSKLRIGSATVAARRICRRCVMVTLDPDTVEPDASLLRRINLELDGRFAVNAEVLEAGRVAIGDAVERI